MYIGKQYYDHVSQAITLTQAECQQIHAASLQVLESCGMVVQHPKALELLAAAGAMVDGQTVRLNPSLVANCLKQAPNSITIYDRLGEAAMFLEGRNVYYGTGSDTVLLADFAKKDAQPWTKQQVIDAVKVVDALENLDFTMSMGLISDVHYYVNTREQYAAMIRNTTKPHVVVCDAASDLEDVFGMYIAVRGSKAALAAKPYAVVYNEPTSPLVNTFTAIDKLLLCADYGVPSNYATGGMAGATTPITAAGTIVLSNAECLFGLVMHQLYRPGAPFVYGYGNAPMDLHTVQSAYAHPLGIQIQNGMTDMAHFYNLPCWGEGGNGCSKLCDEQSSLEASQWLHDVALRGCNIVHDVGYINFGLGFSLEHLAICNEIIGRVKAVMQGVEVNPATLAVAEIIKAGPNGDFLRAASTKAQMRKIWQGELSDFNPHTAWQSNGSSSMGQRAHAKIQKIIANHQPLPLDPAADSQIEAILAKARAHAATLS